MPGKTHRTTKFWISSDTNTKLFKKIQERVHTKGQDNEVTSRAHVLLTQAPRHPKCPFSLVSANLVRSMTCISLSVRLFTSESSWILKANHLITKPKFPGPVFCRHAPCSGLTKHLSSCDALFTEEMATAAAINSERPCMDNNGWNIMAPPKVNLTSSMWVFGHQKNSLPLDGKLSEGQRCLLRVVYTLKALPVITESRTNKRMVTWWQARGIKGCKPRSEATARNLALRLLCGSHGSHTEALGLHSRMDENIFLKLTWLLKTRTIYIDHVTDSVWRRKKVVTFPWYLIIQVLLVVFFFTR